MPDLQEELLEFTKVKYKPGENGESLTKRVLNKVNSIVDASTNGEKWQELSEEAQHWVNNNMAALDGEAELRLLEPPSEETAEEEAIPSEESEGDNSEQQEAEADAAEQQEVGVEVTETNGHKAPKRAKTSAKKTAKKMAKKPAKAPAKKAELGEGRGRKGSFELDAKIKVLSKENPKRAGSESHKRFAKYKNGMTVKQAIEAGLSWADMRWDSSHKHISIN